MWLVLMSFVDFTEQNNDGKAKLTGDDFIKLYESFVSEYPILSIEDPFDQDDWAHYTKINQLLGDKVQIVGDDLLVTNPKVHNSFLLPICRLYFEIDSFRKERVFILWTRHFSAMLTNLGFCLGQRVAYAIKEKACNALLLKVNQIGSVTESIEAVIMSKKAGWGVMTSHRSGETEDSFIADLAVGLSTGQIKTGAPCRSERLAKYNQLLRIEEELGDKAVYAGLKFRKPAEPY